MRLISIVFSCLCLLPRSFSFSNNACTANAAALSRSRSSSSLITSTSRLFASASEEGGHINKATLTAVFCTLTTLLCPLSLPYALSSGVGLAVAASSGNEANLKFFTKEDASKIGEVIYDETAKQVVVEKLVKTEANWKKMIERVEAYTNKGQIKNAKDAISGPLFQIKADMRQLSKLGCNGDVYIRAKEGAEANFDYNSGQFELKPLAQRAEVTIDLVNDLYFYGFDKGQEKAVEELKLAEKSFSDWFAIIQSEVKR